MSSSPPTSSAPASIACWARSPVAKTRTLAVLPVPWGRFTVPRTIWSALRGSTPSRKTTTKKFDETVELLRRRLLHQPHRLERAVVMVAIHKVCDLAVVLVALSHLLSLAVVVRAAQPSH